ncbi:hypothetical protein CTI12_AA387830 [Artemisia annua]|uniref:Uncharacterized protein n=1 Tax=Artemisia annua TaxID=35608 RepID=A0A2U1LI95_ARTAN|nr:hypothetical protein CTI12_AA387830 [Artemisia annua]
MKEVFARYGYADDVFIPMKRNSSGKRFGFCRFLGIKDQLAFEKVLNNICFGSQKLICYIAKFQRQPTATQSYRKLNETKTQLPNPYRKPSATPINPPLSSVICELKSFEGAAITHNILLDQGFTDFSIKYLGGLHLLILFQDSTTTSNALNNPILLTHFKSLKPWNNNTRITVRITWLTIYGLPPQLWGTESFSAIAELWGKILIPDECCHMQFNRSFGKVCILTERVDFIMESLKIPIGNELFPIRVQESDGDIDSLFNGYFFLSPSDDSHTSSTEPNNKTQTWFDDGADSSEDNSDDDHGDGNNGHETGGGFIPEKFSNGIPFMESTGGDRNMAKATVDCSEEGSSSPIGCEVNDNNVSPMSDTPREKTPAKVAEKDNYATHVKSNTKQESLETPISKKTCGSTPTDSSPNCVKPTSPLNSSNNPQSSIRPQPTKPTITTSLIKYSRRGKSVPPAPSSLIHHHRKRTKRFASLRLIDSINGINSSVINGRDNKNKSKTTSQTTHQTARSSSDMAGVTDSLSLIRRCNIRILSKPCSSATSGSNEVDCIVHLGNEIGFDMRDKDIAVADVLTQGEFKGNL